MRGSRADDKLRLMLEHRSVLFSSILKHIIYYTCVLYLICCDHYTQKKKTIITSMHNVKILNITCILCCHKNRRVSFLRQYVVRHLSSSCPTINQATANIYRRFVVFFVGLYIFETFARCHRMSLKRSKKPL